MQDIIRLFSCHIINMAINNNFIIDWKLSIDQVKNFNERVVNPNFRIILLIKHYLPLLALLRLSGRAIQPILNYSLAYEDVIKSSPVESNRKPAPPYG